MKKSILALSLAICIAMVSCGGPTSGPAEKVLQKKVYVQVVNKYESIGDFVDGICVVRAGWNQYGAINTKGEEIIPVDKYYLGNVVDGMILAKNQDSKYGAYNTKGELVVEYKYEDISEYVSGIARVKVGDWSNAKYGYIDKLGNELIAPKYDNAAIEFSEDMAYVGVRNGWNYKYGYINIKGEEVIPMMYEDAYDFHEGVAAVKTKSGYGYIDAKGELVTPAKYDEVESFSEGLAIVMKKEKLYVINKKGEDVYSFAKNIIPAGSYHEGLLLVLDTKEMKFGYYNKQGEIAIPLEYSVADSFNGGKALTVSAVNGECVFKFIDSKGKVISTMTEDDESLDQYEYVEEVFKTFLEKVVLEAKIQYLTTNIPAELSDAVSALEIDSLINSYVQACLSDNDDLVDNIENKLERMVYKVEDRYGEDIADSFEEYIEEIMEVLE